MVHSGWHHSIPKSFPPKFHENSIVCFLIFDIRRHCDTLLLFGTIVSNLSKTKTFRKLSLLFAFLPWFSPHPPPIPITSIFLPGGHTPSSSFLPSLPPSFHLQTPHLKRWVLISKPTPVDRGPQSQKVEQEEQEDKKWNTRQKNYSLEIRVSTILRIRTHCASN